MTLPHLVCIFQLSQTTTVDTLTWLFNINSEIGKFAEELVRHSKLHVFKLGLVTEAAVHVTHQHWAKDHEWRLKNEVTNLVEPIEILHGNLPEKLSPTLVIPKFKKNEIQGLKASLLPSRKRMSQEEQTWWQLFIGKHERGRRFWDSRAEKTDATDLQGLLVPYTLRNLYRDHRNRRRCRLFADRKRGGDIEKARNSLRYSKRY